MAAHLEFIRARFLVDNPLNELVALDLHNLLVSPLMQPCQLACPFVHLCLLVQSLISRLDGNIVWPWAEYQASWRNPWLNIFLFVTRAGKAVKHLLLKSCDFAEGCRAWKSIA